MKITFHLAPLEAAKLIAAIEAGHITEIGVSVAVDVDAEDYAAMYKIAKERPLTPATPEKVTDGHKRDDSGVLHVS